jgi:redox-sensitive bicupin YhaK (pirin superfamily)
MPAVTVDDILTLPRLREPDPAAASPRPVRTVTTAPRGFEGEGFPVRRAFAGVDLAALDPFIHMDQMGEVEYAPGEPKGTPWHPHRGFETVTYIIDGTFVHQDSHGGGGVITNGDTQWMTAGSGLLHIETPPEELVVSGGLFHGIQLWVNLPARDKWAPPRYQDIRGGKVTLLSSADGGALVRVIAGELDGHPGPGVTYTPITLAHASISPGATLDLPWRPDFNALVYVLSGNGTVGTERRPVRTGQLAVLGAGESLRVAADTQQDSRTPGLDVLLLGGRPIREPVAAYGPFVMNTRAELVQAFEDFQAGKLGTVPAEGLHAHGAVRWVIFDPCAPSARPSRTPCRSSGGSSRVISTSSASSRSAAPPGSPPTWPPSWRGCPTSCRSTSWASARAGSGACRRPPTRP